MDAVDPLLHECEDESEDDGGDDIGKIDIGNDEADGGADEDVEEVHEEEFKKKLSIHCSRHLFRSRGHRDIYPSRIPQDHPSFRLIR